MNIRYPSIFEKSNYRKPGLRVVVFILALCVSQSLMAQNAGLGTDTPDASALLELSSTSHGFLMPRLSSAQRNLVASPATGLVIFNTTTNQFEYNAGTPGAPSWVGVVSSTALNTIWLLSGNAATNPATHFLGTSDAQPLVFRTNNTERMRILSGGNVGIGATNPLALFSVGPNSEFRINAAGAITQAAGIASGGNIDFSALNGGGLVSAAAGTGRLGLAVAGSDYEEPLTFTNGLSRSGASVEMGGSFTTDVLIAGGANDFVISGTGLTGLGIGTPVQKLDIAGALRLGTTAFATAGTIRWNGADFQGHDGTNWLSLTAGGGGSGGGNAWFVTGNTLSAGNFLGSINNEALVFRTNNLERMRISAAGSVGIGIGAPVQLLDIAGALRLGSTVVATAGTIRWNGLDFEGHDGTSWLSLTANSGSAQNYWSVTGNTLVNGNFLGSVNSIDLVFRTNNTDRVRISGTNGNIGIGVANPSRTLDVNGDVRIGTEGTTIANIIKSTVSKDLGVILTNEASLETFTVTGASPGASVMVSPQNILPNGLIISYARVSAANTVEVKFYNAGLSSVNAPLMNYYITVIE